MIHPSRPRLRAPAAVVGALALLAGAPTPASASAESALSSWAVSAGAFFEDTTSASRTTVAAGRVWQVSFDRVRRPVLRSRRLDGGRADAVRLPLRTPSKAVDVLSEGFDGTGEDTQLFVADGRAFVSGGWCIDRDEDTNDCNRERSFYAQFSTRTGQPITSSYDGPRRHLVGGTRVSELVRPVDRPAYLRDLRSGKRALTIPANARDVQGAGRLVSWKQSTIGPPRDETGGPFWRTLHVADRATGRERYTLRQATLRRATQPRGRVLVQQADLRADGSLLLDVSDIDPKTPFRPVVVDARGRVQRVTRRPMLKPTQFTSETRGGRVLLSVNTNGEGTCGPPTGWLTEIGGRQGNDLRNLPRSNGFRLSLVPTFLTAESISWNEQRTGRPAGSFGRVRVGHDTNDIALTTHQRPRC